MKQIFIGIGSNAKREDNIQSGVRALRQLFGELRISAVYESEPVGGTGERFYNLVASAHTELPLRRLLDCLKKIERDHGRTSTTASHAVSCTLDLDLLLFGELVCDSPVTLPRQDITERAFVLLPLSELAPEQRHPLVHLRYRDMWQTFRQHAQWLRKVPFDWSDVGG